MGFPVDLFVDKPDDEFICSICFDFFQDPVMVDADCEHVFCKPCINGWNEKSPDKYTCPLGRKPFKGVNALPRMMTTIINRHKLHCQFKKFGCGEILTIEGITEHQKLCQFDPDKRIDCAAGCGAKLWSFENHNCEEYLKNKVQLQTRNIIELEGKFKAIAIDCSKGCGAKLIATNKEVHQCLDYLKGLVYKQELKITDLKGIFGAYDQDEGEDREVHRLPPLKKPGVDYAVCISAQLTCEESNRLGIKLGEIIEIVRKKFGDKTHLAVKDGKPGLVGTANVQLSTYEKVYGDREIAQCTTSDSYTSPLLAFKFLDVIQIICKDVKFTHQNRNQVGWLAELDGNVGYFLPKDGIIIKQNDIFKP